jgi:hypothetical protein
MAVLTFSRTIIIVKLLSANRAPLQALLAHH